MSLSISDYVARALVYVSALNSVGVKPWTAAVDAYATTKEPKGEREVKLGQLVSSWADVLGRYSTFHEGESVTAYLQAVWWASETDGQLELTEIGEGVVKALRAASIEDGDKNEIGVTILSPEDPMRYAMLARDLAGAGAGLLIDPYFKESHVEWLASATTMQRVLVGSRTKGQKDELPMIAYRLGRVHASERKLEVRHTDSKNLHDRGFVAAEGEVSLLGTSLTGIAVHISAITPLPPQAAKPMRQHFERLWDAATVLNPRDGFGELIASEAAAESATETAEAASTEDVAS